MDDASRKLRKDMSDALYKMLGIALGNKNVDWDKFEKAEADGDFNGDFTNYYIEEPAQLFTKQVTAAYPDIAAVIGESTFTSMAKTLVKFENGDEIIFPKGSGEETQNNFEIAGTILIARLYWDLKG